MAGDSPTEGTVEGPLAPQASPNCPAAEVQSEMRPTERDARQSDGVGEFKKRERSSTVDANAQVATPVPETTR